MSDDIYYEPFLKSKRVEFHSIFTIFDPALSNSEIKPVHLGIPRNRNGQKAVIKPTTPLVDNPSSRSPPKRLLGKTVTPSKPKAEEKVEITPPRQRVVVTDTKPKIRRNYISNIGQYEHIQEYINSTPDYWTLPLPPSLSLRYEFRVAHEKKSEIFTITLEKDRQVLLTGVKQSGKIDQPIQVFFDGEEAVITQYEADSSGSCIFGGFNDNEIVALNLNPTLMSNSSPRNFDIIVPALKKSNGKGRLIAIPIGEASELRKKAATSSKEAIILKAREPIKNNSDFDLSHEGKYDVPSISNISFYHASNAKKDLCVFSCSGEDHYFLEISYPMTPLQGFIVGITAAMTI